MSYSYPYSFIPSAYGANAHEVLYRAGPSGVYYRDGFNTLPVNDRINYRTYISGYYPSKINYDPNPIVISAPPETVTQVQNIYYKRLRPPTPPTPPPIVIRERQMPPLPPEPPINIVQIEEPRPTPSPITIRNKTPKPPEQPSPVFIDRMLPPPTPPPRQVIIERFPAADKPQDIYIEEWEPYKELKNREIQMHLGPYYNPLPTPKNVIIQHQKPIVQTKKRYHNRGVVRIDNPETYSSFDLNRTIVNEIDQILEPNLSSRKYNRYRSKTPTLRYKQSKSFTNLSSRPKTAIYSNNSVYTNIIKIIDN